MDIGGHRFFSKSDRVMEWWVELMPPDVGGYGVGARRESDYRDQLSGKEACGWVPAHLQEEPYLAAAGPIDPPCGEETSWRTSVIRRTGDDGDRRSARS